MKRTTFLPIFFTALAVVFGIAVWVRLSAYETTSLRDDNVGQAPARPDNVREGREPGLITDNASADTGTIVEIGTTSAAASTRQQRYNELLRTPPPSAPIAPPAPKESFLDRVVNPIANALGMNRPKQPPPQSSNVVPQRPNPQQDQQARASEEQRREETKRAEKEPRGEEDPETDVAPPQLVGANFNPQQVKDDGETMLAVQVTDNLSGVRSVSGVISSPSGALQGFSCQRDGEGDRFVARIKVPSEAAEGLWNVKYLTLSDNANNSVNLNQSAGTLPASASFRVASSASDSAPPVLRSVYLEKRSMNAGERNTVFVQAEDDKSGVALVSGVFVSPSKQARIGFGCRAGSAGAWECTVSPPACLDCGAWRLEQVQVQDKANNMATFRGDNQLVSQIVLDISGQSCDAGPPQITALALNPTVVSNTEGGTINITALVQDDSCGVASLSGQAIPAGAIGGQRIPFSFDPSPDGQNFTGRISVPKHAAKGLWTIAWIQALDKGHNLRAYGAAEPVLARVTFRVE
ncbi:MAG TPA: hypothetical protein VGQ36_16575 [Thermoanaerobaculia bacterium]|jgi:hypothetical protein|nr:hypothetical protein [Thermoanaerobaculia bacterium]